MKLVREYIEPVNVYSKMDFEKTGDPLKDMRMGIKAKISQWLDMMDIEGYQIADDLSITVLKDVNLVNRELEELPEFINFHKIWGSFYAGGNPWQSLRGFPKEIYGDLQINSISNILEDGEINPKINKRSIKKMIKVYGQIWI